MAIVFNDVVRSNEALLDVQDLNAAFGLVPYLVQQGKVSHINVGASLMEHVTLFVIGVVGLCALLIVFKFFMKKPGA